MNWAYTSFLILFGLSGAAGLAYQMAWARMLTAGLGHEVPAVLSVIAAIFGGMAVGAVWSDRVLRRSARPGRYYGWLELVIGTWGGVSIALIPLLNHAAETLIGLEPSPARQWSIALTLPCVLLLPATAAMGATFPLLEGFLSSCRPGKTLVGTLYSWNTFGAVVGVILSTVLLLPSLGFSRTIALCASTNLFCGVVTLLVEARWVAHPRYSSKCPIQRQGDAPTPSNKCPGVLGAANQTFAPESVRLMITLFATGLLGLGYEIVGVRALAQVLENTIYTFAAMLAVYLIGTAVGAALSGPISRRFSAPGRQLGLVLAAAITSLTGGFLLMRSETIYLLLQAELARGQLGSWFAEFFTAGAIFFLPTLCMGALFSDLLQRCQQARVGIGRAVAVNTLGAMLAPGLFGLLLVPGLGVKWALVLLGLGYVALVPRILQRWWWALIPVLLSALLPAQIRFVEVPDGGKLLHYREGVMDSVAVVGQADGNRTLVVNSRFTMGGTGATLAERRHADLPLLLHPHPTRALFLGLGTGITFGAIGVHENLHADGVELVPEIVSAMPWFQPQNTLPPGPFKIFTADARRFVRTSHVQYDVIVADLFHPARDGAAALYAVEHFRAIRSRLAAGGLFCQWLPLYQLDAKTLRVIIRTFLEVYPDARAFLLRLNVDTPVLGLVGSLTPRRYGLQYFEQRVQNQALIEQLNSEQLRDPFHLLGCFLAGPEALRRFSAGAPINTDDRPVVLFDAPRCAPDESLAFQRFSKFLGGFASDPAELIDLQSKESERFTRQVSEYIAARNTYLRGLLAESEGDKAAAFNAYLHSAELSSQFATGYAQCLTLAMQEAKVNPRAARQLLERMAAAQPSRPVAAQLLQRLFPE